MDNHTHTTFKFTVGTKLHWRNLDGPQPSLPDYLEVVDVDPSTGEYVVRAMRGGVQVEMETGWLEYCDAAELEDSMVPLIPIEPKPRG
jgi:hypothetical protein